MSQNRAVFDRLLTNVSMKRETKGYISELLLPELNVKQRSGKIAGFGQNHLRIANSIAVGKGKFREVETVKISTSNYSIEKHGLEEMLTEEDADNYESPFVARSLITENLTGMLLTEKEIILRDAISDKTIITNNITLSGNDQWSDVDSDPLALMLDIRGMIRSKSGAFPDTMWADGSVLDRLRLHPKLLVGMGYTQARPGGLTDQELARLFNVRKVLSADAVYQPANVGQGDSMALTPIWGKNLWFGVIPDSVALNQTSMGYRLQLAGKTPRKVKTYGIENPDGAEMIQVQDNYDFLLSDLGSVFLVENVIA